MPYPEVLPTKKSRLKSGRGVVIDIRSQEDPDHSSVDRDSVSKITQLRADLHRISVANREYFENKYHSWDERGLLLQRQQRIHEIKAQLEAILTSKTA